MSQSSDFRIEQVHNTCINIHGWRIVRSDGAVLLPLGRNGGGFPTKGEAEKLVEFFLGEVRKNEAELN